MGCVLSYASFQQTSFKLSPCLILCYNLGCVPVCPLHEKSVHRLFAGENRLKLQRSPLMIISLTVHAMCEQIKCAGRNNFSTNQFKTKLFQDIFWPSHCQFRCTFRRSLSTVKLHRWVYFWQRPPASSF
jgi:hypothetical protein